MCVCGSWTAECSRRSWWRRVYSDRRRIYASSEGPYIQHICLKIDLRRSLYTANRAHNWPQKVLIIYNRKGLVVNLKRSLYRENNANNSEGPYIEKIGLTIDFRRSLYTANELTFDLRRSLYTSNRADSWPQKGPYIQQIGLPIYFRRSLYTADRASSWAQKVPI